MPDLEAAVAELRRAHGIGWVGIYGTTVSGVTGSIILLEPPQDLETVTVADRIASEAAERTARVIDAGRRPFS